VTGKKRASADAPAAAAALGPVGPEPRAAVGRRPTGSFVRLDCPRHPSLRGGGKDAASASTIRRRAGEKKPERQENEAVLVGRRRHRNGAAGWALSQPWAPRNHGRGERPASPVAATERAGVRPVPGCRSRSQLTRSSGRSPPSPSRPTRQPMPASFLPRRGLRRAWARRGAPPPPWKGALDS
jgi:hypothetical protein